MEGWTQLGPDLWTAPVGTPMPTAVPTAPAPTSERAMREYGTRRPTTETRTKKSSGRAQQTTEHRKRRRNRKR